MNRTTVSDPFWDKTRKFQAPRKFGFCLAGFLETIETLLFRDSHKKFHTNIIRLNTKLDLRNKVEVVNIYRSKTCLYQNGHFF